MTKSFFLLFILQQKQLQGLVETRLGNYAITLVYLSGGMNEKWTWTFDSDCLTSTLLPKSAERQKIHFSSCVVHKTNFGPNEQIYFSVHTPWVTELYVFIKKDVYQL